MLNHRTKYYAYWTIGAFLCGVLMAPIFNCVNPDDHSNHYTHDHSSMAGKIEVPTDSVPNLSIEVTKDMMSGWNLSVDVENFTFTPEKINSSNQINEGHAHIYVNGEKLSRLYGSHFHISEFPPGKYEISVSLNANDHSTYTSNGEPIVAKTSIIQNGVSSR